MSDTTNNPLISPQALYAVLSDLNLLIIDATVELPAPRFDGDYQVRSGRDGWLQAHIPGAVHADLYGALADQQASFSFALPGIEQLARGFAELGISPQRRVVIYDRNDGFWAARLWWMLRSVGLQAEVLDGGFKAWQHAGLPQQGGDVAPQASHWQPAYEQGFWIDRAGVEAILAGERSATLVCALSAGLFEGSAVTRYARRGHIPGSLNIPARGLFDEHGRYLQPQALRTVLEPLLQTTAPVVVYCGGGISAAAQALALTLVGRANVLLYDGSLQEWAADSRLPLTTGAAPA